MSPRKARALPGSLEKVQRRFERWRQTRKIPARKKTTPEERIAARRPRFLDRQVSYVKHARRAIRRLTKLGNTTHYDYTGDEAKQIMDAILQDVDNLRRAFVGSPKEKGLFDL